MHAVGLSDHSCKNRSKRKDVLRRQSPVEDLVSESSLFSY